MGAERFKIAVLPDTQELTQLKNQRMDYSAAGPGMSCFYAQMAWLRSKAADENIVFATHLGDLWQSYGSDEAIAFQAPAASNALYVLHGIMPYSTVPGNHDYDSSTTAPGFDQTPGKPHWRPRVIDGLKLYHTYFGSGSFHFRDQPWYLESFRIGNSATTFTAGGYAFIHLGLEMEPDDQVLDWAQSVVDRQWNLLYTAVTRGQELVVLVGDHKAIAIAVNRVDSRRQITRLKEHLTVARMYAARLAAQPCIYTQFVYKASRHAWAGRHCQHVGYEVQSGPDESRPHSRANQR